MPKVLLLVLSPAVCLAAASLAAFNAGYNAGRRSMGRDVLQIIERAEVETPTVLPPDEQLWLQEPEGPHVWFPYHRPKHWD